MGSSIISAEPVMPLQRGASGKDFVQAQSSMPATNLDVCRLLGIHNTDDVASVTLEIKPQSYPLLTVKRMLRGPAGLHEFAERFVVTRAPEAECPESATPIPAGAQEVRDAA